jgi:glycosyltransferase involved in cell wall biosynthesis
MPSISVILPAYNAQDYLTEAIESILNQTFNDFEFLIFNDGSTDSTKTIIDSYNDKRIKAFHSDENKGYVHWLNIGLKDSQGKYIARMDADDISLPERFQLQWDFMEKHLDVGVCGGQIITTGTNEPIKKPLTDDEIRWWFFKGCPLTHPSVFIRKAILDKWNLTYDKKLQPAEDYDMWWRMAQVTKMANLTQVLLKHRYHAQQESTANSEIQQKNYQKSLSNFFLMIGIQPREIDKSFTLKLFSDELEYTPCNLKLINLFFNNIDNSDAKAFFGSKEISEQKKYWMYKCLNRLSCYHPSILFQISWSILKDFHQQNKLNLIKFTFKCLVFWKTRIR